MDGLPQRKRHAFDKSDVNTPKTAAWADHTTIRANQVIRKIGRNP